MIDFMQVFQDEKVIILISLVVWGFLGWGDTIAGFFLEHFDESAQIGHSFQLVVDLEDVAISEVCFVKSTHVSCKVSQ